MSEYSIRMSPEAREALSSLEEMPEYRKVFRFLDKWELSEWSVWAKVGTNEKFKILVEIIRKGVHLPDFYRDHNLNKITVRNVPVEMEKIVETYIIENLDRYKIHLKNAARLIEMFEEKEDFYLERDRISEAAITYDFCIQYFLEYGDEDEIEL